MPTFLILIMTIICWLPQILARERIPFINPALIPDVEEKLEILNAPEYADVLANKIDNRPQKCPLRSEKKFSNIQEQLESIAIALRYGECYNKNREIIDGLQTILSEEDQLFASMRRNDQVLSSENVSDQDGKTLIKRQKIFDVLKNVSGDEACLYNIRKRGLLPVMADVLINIGQVSSLIPSMNGFYLSAAAVSLGTTLKIIASVFGSDFDWKDVNERTQFLQLNCNFFHLRRELEAAEVVQIRDEYIPEKIERSKLVKIELSNYNNALRDQRQATRSEITYLRSTYLSSVLPEKTLEISKAINSLQAVVPKIDISFPEDKLSIIQEYTNQISKLLNSIEGYHYKPPYKGFLISLMKTLSWENLPNNIAEKNEILRQNILEPIHYYLDLYQQEISNLIEEKIQIFLAAENRENRLSNLQIIDQMEDNYEQILFELDKSISFIDTRIEILGAKDTKLSLNSFDKGAQTIYDILESYHFIKSILIGKLGYSCLDYFREKMSQGLNQFKKSYFIFKKKYFQNNPDNGLYEDLWPCRDANSLRVLWEKVDSASEVANDFIQTNTDIFQSDVRKVGKFLKILPVNLSRELSMLKYVRSAEYATSMLNGEIPLDRKKLRKIELIKNKNLGLLLIKRGQYTRKRVEIEKFWNSRDCGSIL